MENYIK